ncbi:MAG: nusA [Bacillales bacterium]|jgi:N utilization substance protein A|nr:nusA [Bacillales bacterium]
MSSELFSALKALESEKGISFTVLVEAVEAALVAAYQKNFNKAQNVRVDFNVITGDAKVFAKKEVKEVIEDERLHISLEEAKAINAAYEIDDIVEFEVTPRDFGRVAAQAAKQLIVQRVREAERGIIYDEFIDRQDDIITGVVQRKDAKNYHVQIGRTEAILPVTEILPNEKFEINQRIKLYITKVDKTTKGPQIQVSRTNPGLLKRLFEMEVPEIYEGIVEIKSVAREAGDRSKISVWSSNPEVDPIGACVGAKGDRVQTIVNELKGEKIDIVEWSDNVVDYVANALSPSDVLEVHVNEAEKSTVVIVPDSQLSLAIGRKGQNVRLAARLTGWKIDIKNETDARELGILTETFDEYYEDEYENFEEDFEYET